MHLTVDGRSVPVAQLGPDFVIFAEPVDLPPVQGEMWLSVDGHQTSWRVDLPQGASAETQKTPLGRPF